MLDSAAARDSAAADTFAFGLAQPDSAAAALLEATQTAPPETVLAAEHAPAPSALVLLGGREIFRVRVGRDGLDPVARAAAIRGRLNRAVADGSVPPDSVRLVSTPAGIQVRFGPHFLWLITAGDAPSQDLTELAAYLAELPPQIRDGIERERAGRRPARVLISIAIALAFTLVAFGLHRALLILGRRWRDWLKHFLAGRLPSIRIRSFEVLSKAQITGLVTAVLGRLDIPVGLLLLYFYLTAVFSLFPWTQGWSRLLLAFALGEILRLLHTLWSALPGLFTIVLIFILFRWLGQLADRFFDAIAAGTLTISGFHPELARPSRRLVRILLWVVAVMIAYPYIPGSGSKAVQGVSLLLGIMVSLGSTGFIGNVIAGIILTYSRSFRVGDRVRIGDHVGDVVNLGFFATKLKSIRNEEITIPNGQVANAAILNYTRLAADPGLVLHTEVTIGYDVEWRKVHALLVEAAVRVEGIEKRPEPQVFQRSLNDHHVSYELTCVTHQSHQQLGLYSDLHAEIQDAFAQAGIEILSPGYHAVRDANAPALPDHPEGPRRKPGAFRVGDDRARG